MKIIPKLSDFRVEIWRKKFSQNLQISYCVKTHIFLHFPLVPYWLHGKLKKGLLKHSITPLVSHLRVELDLAFGSQMCKGVECEHNGALGTLQGLPIQLSH